MKTIDLLSRAILLISLAGSSFAADDLLLRVDPSAVQAVAKQYGLKIEKQLKSGDGVYVASLPNGASKAAVLQALQSDPRVQNAEPNDSVVLTKNPKAVQQALQNAGCAPTALVSGKYSVHQPGGSGDRMPLRCAEAIRRRQRRRTRGHH